jgi:hypothetical protein
VIIWCISKDLLKATIVWPNDTYSICWTTLVYFSEPLYCLTKLAYLTDRTSFVSLCNCLSTTVCCVTGVPRGSVLGHLLFWISTTLVGWLISGFNIPYHHYADDNAALYIGWHVIVSWYHQIVIIMWRSRHQVTSRELRLVKPIEDCACHRYTSTTDQVSKRYSIHRIIGFRVRWH